MNSLLDTHRPERLLDEFDPDQLLAAVLATDTWSPRQLSSIDYVLSHWTAQFAARQDQRSLAELQSVIGRLLEQCPPPEPYGHRWRALDDVLEARRLTLAARSPERVAGMKHVRRILDCIAEAGPTRQGDLLEQLALGISVSRLSQIVSLMEAHGLIDVQKRGRERFLHLAAMMRDDRAAATLTSSVGVLGVVGSLDHTQRKVFSRGSQKPVGDLDSGHRTDVVKRSRLAGLKKARGHPMAGKDDRTPDSVTHGREHAVPFIPTGVPGPEIHTTTIEKEGQTTTGHGWSREEADKDAGDKYSRGETDKK